ncbi:MAG: NAD(+) synthase [Anaerolineaceae bacterium]|nr:NAD(+) synthase [Anaerolineaceae bacterium]
MKVLNHSLNELGFLRLAVVTPEMRLADVDYNADVIISTLGLLAKDDVHMAVFPELCISGYSCGDLFHQTLLLEKAHHALFSICEAVKKYNMVTVVGLPLKIDNNLFNSAAIIDNNGVAGFILKAYRFNDDEARWFSSAQLCQKETIEILGRDVPVGENLLFQANNQPECMMGVEICNHLMLSRASCREMISAGANLIVNLAAVNEELGKAENRRKFFQQQSSSYSAIFALSSSGPNESSTDFVFSGHSMIAENGLILAETERFKFTTQISIADVDLQTIMHDRLKQKTNLAEINEKIFRTISFSLPVRPLQSGKQPFLRSFPQMPFLPPSLSQPAILCQEAFDIQSAGLAKRLKHTGSKTVTLGLSGGLDSALALLVCIKAFEILGLDRQGIHALSMPGPGTTARTKGNSRKLAESLGVSFREIPIDNALKGHLKEIGHSGSVHDTTYENSQARERTQILMDIGNQIGGFTVGTGDLSELALGWCTYNGDHMSMYHVNAGVPKTLIRIIIKWFSENAANRVLADILIDIYETPISPELLSPTEAGIHQNTEDIIGPYILHDFFLFYTVKFGFSPRKIFFMARQAFEQEYPTSKILTCMNIFYKRFISQQFKRSAMPDGPKVISIGLSPREAWRMSSDVSPSLWMNAMVDLEEEFGQEKGL